MERRFENTVKDNPFIESVDELKTALGDNFEGFNEINLDPEKGYQTKEGIAAAAEVATVHLDNKEMAEKVSNINVAQEALKESGMSTEDYDTIQYDSGISWGENGIVEYGEFLGMTYEQ
jgi:hypothetical protein